MQQFKEQQRCINKFFNIIFIIILIITLCTFLLWEAKLLWSFELILLAALQFVKCEPLIGTRNKEIIGFDGNEIAQQKFHCLKILFFIGCIFWYFIYISTLLDVKMMIVKLNCFTIMLPKTSAYVKGCDGESKLM